ncbi:hypothetical protein [Streptomyces sp. V1I1]|uniref:hypothetical protein n=1 Tax=Streptomyces sp. V1I1 TaxID=3042272 RepID=UPI002789D314|nr:hypothetical protein [Streptomyces sp. V1I1]MDQ0941146.1 hypothetical protein [Streptomyces sp. V1I1]
MENEEKYDFDDNELSDAAASALRVILRTANPALRVILLRRYGIYDGNRPAEGTFNSFIEPEL